MATKTKSLKPLLDSLKFDYCNENIADLFPYEPTTREIEVFNFGRVVTSDEAIKEMAAKGYTPATASELFDWYAAHKDWQPQPYCGVVALGSVATFGRDQRACRVWLGDSERDANLHWFGRAWLGYYWFAFGRESTQTSEPLHLHSETWPLDELEINGVKYRKV